MPKNMPKAAAKTYAEKLRDPRWQQARLKVMERDKFTCRCCQSKENTLNVHHSHYRKGAEPWDYEIEHLVTLCEECHKLVEARRNMLLADTVNPRIQIIVMQFAAALANRPSPYPRHFGLILESLHSMFENTEEIVFADDQRTAEDSLESLKENIIELQEWLFRMLDDVRGQLRAPERWDDSTTKEKAD